MTSTTDFPGAASASALLVPSSGTQTMIEYDNQGRPYQATVSVIDQGSGQITSTQTSNDWYNGRGDVIETLSANGLTTKSQYDGADRLVLEASTNGGGGTSYAAAGTLNGDVVFSQTQYVYDGDGNTIETIQKTRLAGDSSAATGGLGNATTAPMAQVTYGYDQFGRLTSLDYSQGQTTLVNHGWSYDADGDVTQYVNSIDGTANYSYDATGQLLALPIPPPPPPRPTSPIPSTPTVTGRRRRAARTRPARTTRSPPTARTRIPTMPTATAPAAPASPTAR